MKIHFFSRERENTASIKKISTLPFLFFVWLAKWIGKQYYNVRATWFDWPCYLAFSLVPTDKSWKSWGAAPPTTATLSRSMRKHHQKQFYSLFSHILLLGIEFGYVTRERNAKKKQNKNCSFSSILHIFDCQWRILVRLKYQL